MGSISVGGAITAAPAMTIQVDAAGFISVGGSVSASGLVTFIGGKAQIGTNSGLSLALQSTEAHLIGAFTAAYITVSDAVVLTYGNVNLNGVGFGAIGAGTNRLIRVSGYVPAPYFVAICFGFPQFRITFSLVVVYSTFVTTNTVVYYPLEVASAGSISMGVIGGTATLTFSKPTGAGTITCASIAADAIVVSGSPSIFNVLGSVTAASLTIAETTFSASSDISISGVCASSSGTSTVNSYVLTASHFAKR